MKGEEGEEEGKRGKGEVPKGMGWIKVEAEEGRTRGRGGKEGQTEGEGGEEERNNEWKGGERGEEEGKESGMEKRT